MGMRSASRSAINTGLLGVYLSLLLVLSGCASAPERSPVPADRYDDAALLGAEGLRHWGDEPAAIALDLPDDPTREQVRAVLPALYGSELSMLAISGGGANGAFAAGLLNGWSDSGERPVFSVVTGISTGALIAPFAFLGADYDPVIRNLYTQYETEDLVEDRGLLKFILGGESAFDTERLRRKIAEYIDGDLLAEIAQEYRKGRFLFIGTTNLDAARPVIWDIGAIAASGRPGALDLVHEVILASAAIPIVFPPVLIDVEIDGETYDEMHMDGGVSRQSFLFSLSSPEDSFDLLDLPAERTAYVIRNSKSAVPWRSVDRSLIAIAGRSANAMVHSQGLGDLYREFIAAHKFGFDFKLAYIPASFSEEPDELFDREYMRKLYKFAYDLALEGYPWENVPPGIEDQGTQQGSALK